MRHRERKARQNKNKETCYLEQKTEGKKRKIYGLQTAEIYPEKGKVH
jgi:hypothetical protein